MSIQPKTPPQTALPRPFPVTILSALVLIFVGLHLLRGVYALARWSFLAELPGASPLYLAFTGLIWAVAGSLVFWGLRRPRPWAPRFTRGAALAYALYYWVDRLWLAQNAVTPTNWPIPAALTLLSLAYVFAALRYPKSRLYFNPAAFPSLPARAE